MTTDRIWSLLEVHKFYAAKFLKAHGAFERLDVILKNDFGSNDLTIGSTTRDDIREITENCAGMGLSITAAAGAKMMEFCENDPVELDGFKYHVRHVRDCMHAELSENFFYALDKENQEFLNICNQGAWPSILNSGKVQITEDIEEAGRCFAFENYTASVFHLMRAMEICVRLLAGKLGATVVDKNDNPLTWIRMLKNIDDKINKFTNNSDKTTWSNISADLRAVGIASRNPTMHPKNTYQPREAKRLFDACEGFIEKLLKVL